jgi:hypothetical protein
MITWNLLTTAVNMKFVVEESVSAMYQSGLSLNFLHPSNYSTGTRHCRHDLITTPLSHGPFSSLHAQYSLVYISPMNASLSWQLESLPD